MSYIENEILKNESPVVDCLIRFNQPLGIQSINHLRG